MNRPTPLDVIAVALVASSGRRCRNCRHWPTLTAADIRRVRRALERVLACNASGICMWCSPRRARAQRKRDADRWLPLKRKQKQCPT